MASIQELRKKLADWPNLSHLARRACVSGKSLYRIRDGSQIPSIDTFDRIVRALNGEDLRNVG